MPWLPPHLRHRARCLIIHSANYAQICRDPATAAITGNLTKIPVSRAECGCQAEIPSACSTAVAAPAELYFQDPDHRIREASMGRPPRLYNRKRARII